MTKTPRERGFLFEAGFLECRVCVMSAKSSLLADALGALRLAGVLITIQTVLALAGVVPMPFGDLLEPFAFVAVGYLTFYLFLLQMFSGQFPPRWNAVTALAGGVLGILLVMAAHDAFPDKLGITELSYVFLGGLGISALVAYALRWRRVSGSEAREPLTALLVFGFVLWMISPLPGAALSLTALLHPTTLDPVAFHFDQTFGFQPSVVLASAAATWRPVRVALSAVYTSLPFGFAILFALMARYPGQVRFHLLRFWVLSGAFAYVAYHIVPITGPRFLFGSAFPHALPDPELIPWSSALVQPAPRNGIPSMHFGWSFAFWLVSLQLNAYGVRRSFALFMGLTALATLALGEHYLIDLVIAVPFILGIYPLCARQGDAQVRQRMFLSGMAITLAWMLCIRFGSGLVQAMPWLVPLAVLGTLWISRRIFLRFTRATAHDADEAVVEESRIRSRESWAVASLFVFSGLAGLVYEVVFSKALALTFGSTALATHTVLATYMGGMAIGAVLGGMLAQRSRRPLVAYAVCELAIGACVMVTPQLFELVRDVYVMIAAGSPVDAAFLTPLRIGLGATVLLVPTILMGMTLPLLARFLSDRRETLGLSVATLYGANTFGAAAGALLSGYLLIPLLGIQKTIFLAAAVNLLVALAGLRLAARLGMPSLSAQAGEQAAGGLARREGWLALCALAVGGVLTLMLEVDYIHLLAVVAGNSVYAFSLMLATFLAGLAGGAGLAHRLLAACRSPLLVLIWLEFGLALSVLGGVFVWERLPLYFADYADYSLAKTFATREFIRGVACAVVMMPPAFFIGALYPVGFECIGRAFPERRLHMLGRAMAANTFGNIAGVLLAGFVLLPMIGALRSVQLIAGAAALLGLAVCLLGRQPLRSLLPLPLVLVLLAIQPRAFDYESLASGANVYFAAQGFGKVIDHAESIDGGLTTVAVHPTDEKVKTLLTNGKFQGNNAPEGEMRAQAGFAQAPLLHTTGRERALVIGFGTGMTTRVLHQSGFANIDVAEISADIVRMTDRHFGEVNLGVAHAPNVRVHITDGRNFLLLRPERYDVISMEITSIWFAGAASLYNQEFYRLAKTRMTERGVLQQWVQLHHMRVEDFLSLMATLHAEFEYVWLYLIGGQGIVVAGNHPDAGKISGNITELDGTVLLTPEATGHLFDAVGLPLRLLVSTDDNLSLEYGTPRGNVLDGRASMEKVLSTLRAAAALRMPSARQ